MTQRVAEVKRPHLTLSRPPEAGILIWHFITLIAIAIFAQLPFLQSFALAAASSEDPAKDTVDASSALPSNGTIEAWISSELHPMSDKWYTNPWPETDIRYRLTKQPPPRVEEPAKHGNGDRNDLDCPLDHLPNHIGHWVITRTHLDLCHPKEQNSIAAASIIGIIDLA